MEEKGKRNAYTCTKCRGHIITENMIDLVTPFMVACRATEGCDGGMHSEFYPKALNGPLYADELAATTHRWVAYKEEQIEEFRQEGDDAMVEWATGDHGNLVEAK